MFILDKNYILNKEIARGEMSFWEVLTKRERQRALGLDDLILIFSKLIELSMREKTK